jgi:hypothetical protein
MEVACPVHDAVLLRGVAHTVFSKDSKKSLATTFPHSLNDLCIQKPFI